MADRRETSKHDKSGVLHHLAERFPDNLIPCFALLRTLTQGDRESIFDPVAGRITYRQGYLRRDPEGSAVPVWSDHPRMRYRDWTFIQRWSSVMPRSDFAA